MIHNLKPQARTKISESCDIPRAEAWSSHLSTNQLVQTEFFILL
jgi:hypothetical protein